MRLLALNTVLVATSLDDSSLAAIVTGRALAEAADAELHVVNATRDATPDATPDATGVHQQLARAGVPLEAASVHAVAGDPALAISKLAEAISADVIVVGPHRVRTGEHLPIDSTALGIVTNSAAPCLVAHELRLPISHVVVAVDLSETSRGALVVGLSWASALRAGRGTRGVRLTALHVAKQNASADDLSALRTSLDRQVEDLRGDAGSWAGVMIDCQVIVGDDVPGAIARYATNHAAELIVLGTRGLGLDTVARLGSVAAAIAAETTTPTLLVPPAIWLELGRLRPRRISRSVRRLRAPR